jgi:hypothetical protein
VGVDADEQVVGLGGTGFVLPSGSGPTELEHDADLLGHPHRQLATRGQILENWILEPAGHTDRSGGLERLVRQGLAAFEVAAEFQTQLRVDAHRHVDVGALLFLLAFLG